MNKTTENRRRKEDENFRLNPRGSDEFKSFFDWLGLSSLSWRGRGRGEGRKEEGEGEGRREGRVNGEGWGKEGRVKVEGWEKEEGMGEKRESGEIGIGEGRVRWWKKR